MRILISVVWLILAIAVAVNEYRKEGRFRLEAQMFVYFAVTNSSIWSSG